MDNALHIIADIRTAYPQKFGIPRQSGLVGFPAEIIFRPNYRSADAVRGLDGFSHIWVLWGFSEAGGEWSPTVRPPRLGGNRKIGVFATRSPFRPNRIGLSSLKLERVELTAANGPVLHVLGADMLDGTPVYDIKPYLKFTDSHPDAVCGFADDKLDYRLEVRIPDRYLEILPEEIRPLLIDLLSGDPRPSYQNDPQRVYGIDVAGYSVHFTVENGVLMVTGVKKTEPTGF